MKRKKLFIIKKNYYIIITVLKGIKIMERKVGTISRGIRCPIIRKGDNLVDITVNSVLEAAESENFSIRE